MKARERKSLLIGFGGLLWLLAVFLMYAYTHKPFTPSQAALLVKESWQIAVAFGIVSLAGGAGYRLFPTREGWNGLVLLAVQAALGFGVLALVIFAVGVTVGFSGTIFTILFFIGAIFLYKSIFLWWKEWAAFTAIWQKSGKFEKALAGGVFFVLFISFAKSLAPSLAFDSLVYHLTLPKLYLLDGRISYIPELIFWGMPQQLEMGMTFAMALGGVEAAVLFSWALGALALIGLLGYLSDRFSVTVAWVGLGCVLVGQTFVDSLSWAYVEWTVMLYGFAVFVLLDAWSVDREGKLLWLAALLAGFAVGTKYTAGVLLVAVVPLIFVAHGKKGTRNALKDLFAFGIITLLVISPWLLKNFMATGNPVYPLLFPAGEMNAFRLELYQGDPAWGDWRDLIFLPWRATIWGINGAVGYSAEIGSLLLAFSVFAGLNWREQDDEQKTALRTAFWITFVGFVLWAVAGRTSRLLIQSRLYFVFFPAWAMLAGVGFENFSKLRASGVRFGRVASALLLLSFGFGLYQSATSFVALSPLKVLFGVQTPSKYREQALGRYETAMSTLAELPEDANILFLWETRGFACVPYCEPDEVIDRWYADLRTYGSPDAVLDAWRNAGYTHLFFNKRGADFIQEDDAAYTANDWRALDAALGQLELLYDFDGEYQIFSLEY